MESLIDVLMITELNLIFKEQGIACSLHTVGGCSVCGIELRCQLETIPYDEILRIVNAYLAQKWLVASYHFDDKNLLYVESKFKSQKRS